MNELEFLRRQIATERGHMAAVRSACAASLAQPDVPPDPGFLESCADYLVYVVSRFNDQDEAHASLLRPRLDATDAAGRAVIDDLLATLAANREAIGRLCQALEARRAGDPDDGRFIDALRNYLTFYASVLATRRHALQPLFDRHYGIAEWRLASRVDADSIIEERERYARVADRLPEGVVLAASELSATALRAAAHGNGHTASATGQAGAANAWTPSRNPRSTP